VVQDAFIRVWKNLDEYRPETRFTTWLYKIVINLSYDTMKGHKRRRTALGSIADRFGRREPVADCDPLEETERRDMYRHVITAAEVLSQSERLVFTLRDVQDLSMEEVLHMTGMSAGSIRATLCHARKRIREHMLEMKDVRL
jgi:RNA polymerase sigma-70 factor (ECF subfamily)